MATTLTKSYQRIKQTKLGDWGYGTLYLRTYAKYTSQAVSTGKSVVAIQSRIYNDGSYCYSGNCYNTLQGIKVKNNVSLDFTANSEITLGTVSVTVTHDDDGSASLSLTNTFKCYALGSTTYSANETVNLPVINRMDKATGLDFDIGSATNITITRYNDDFVRTVVATIGTFSETLLEKGTDTLITWQPEASKLYEQIPNSNTGTITLTTTTYDSSGNVIGTTTSTLKCRVVDSNPIINSVAITDSLSIIEENILVRHMSKPKLAIDASGVNEASIVSYSVTELNSAKITSDSNEIVLDNTITNNSFLVEVIDSRGNTTPATFSAEKFIEYILPAISKLDLVRTGENLDQVQASISGVWFNQSINGTANAISLKYRYKTSTGEYSDYIDITEVPTEAQFTVETLFNPDGGFDTNSVYTIEVLATDNLTDGNLTNLIGKAVPLIDHWNENDKDYYNINAEIQQYGESVKEKNIITAFLATDYTVQASSTYETIPLDSSYSVGSKLTLENNKIKIGSGVTNALVSAKLQQPSAGTSVGGRNIIIRKNGANVSRGMFYQTEVKNSFFTLPPVLIDVQEGDLIELIYYGAAGNIINGYKHFTSLTVEAF